MKLAVLNSEGTQTKDNLKLRHYYIVGDSYNFSGNSATDVSSLENMHLFYRYNKIGISDFRSWLKDYATSEGFSNLSEDDKIVCAKFMAVSKSDRDSVLSEEEQKRYAVNIHEKTYLDKAQSDIKNWLYDKDVSELDNYLSEKSGSVFGTDYDAATNTNTITLSSTSLYEVLSKDVDSSADGKYRLSYQIDIKSVSPDGGWPFWATPTLPGIRIKIQVDGSTLVDLTGSTGEDLWSSLSGSENLDLTRGTHTISVQASSTIGGDAIQVRNAKIEFWRIN